MKRSRNEGLQLMETEIGKVAHKELIGENRGTRVQPAQATKHMTPCNNTEELVLSSGTNI